MDNILLKLKLKNMFACALLIVELNMLDTYLMPLSDVECPTHILCTLEGVHAT